MKKLALLGVSASLLAMIAPSALAQGFYIDGGYSSLITDYEEDDDLTVDLKFGAVSAHAGYDISRYFGIEVEGLYGVTNDSVTLFAVGDELLASADALEDIDYDALDYDVELNYLVGAFAKANWPLTDTFTAFGRVGYVTAEIEASSSEAGASFSASDTGDGPAYGIGLMADLEKNFFIRGDFTLYDIEGAESEAVILGAGLRF